MALWCLDAPGSIQTFPIPTSRDLLSSQAVELYRGDYLEEFFSDWCLVRRENLRLRFISALTTLGDLYLGAAEMGDRASAIRKYQECAEVLREELGLNPMPETEELYQRLIG